MKKINHLLLGGLCLAAIGCAEEMIQPGLNPEGESVFIGLDAPEAIMQTRSVAGTNSANGGLTNVDWTKYDLRYQLAVYSADGSKLLVPPQAKLYDTYSPTSFELRLTPNSTYKFVAWADFVTQGTAEDLHYNTADLAAISVKSEEARLNDESRDAYFASADIDVTQAFNGSLTLKRPFAKLRVVTTDWDESNMGITKPDRIRINYHDCKRFTGLNAVTGEAVGEEEADASVIYSGIIPTDGNGGKFYEGGHDAVADNRTVMTDYIIASSEQQAIHFNMEMLSGETTVISRDFTTQIPIQRNYLTTLIGNLLSASGSVNISIDDNFTNNWIEGEEWWNPAEITPKEPAYDAATKTYSIYNRDEFAWLPDHINEMIEAHSPAPNKYTGFTIKIYNDIDMSGVEWKPIYPKASGLPYTVDGQGHTLKNFSMSGQFGAIYEYIIIKYEAYTGVWGKFDGIMKNLTFENITINGLADAEFPVKEDVDGNPVDHTKEYAYFAGCIGYTGGNQWSMNSKFENVHAKNVHIKSSATSQNLGGLVGWIGSGGGDLGKRVASMKNCSATDIHMTGSQAGGLVGQVLGDRGVSFDDCMTENVYIRNNSISKSSGFIGKIGDGGFRVSTWATVEINNCTPAQNVHYIKDSTGEPITTYTPQSPYYGHKNKSGDKEDKVTITPEE